MANVAIVTGADRGLGLGTVGELVARGWTVFAGQYMAEWPELGELAGKSGGSVEIVPLDVGDEGSVGEAARIVNGKTDRVDMLVSNAGINSLKRDETIRDGLDYEELHRLFNVNSLGALRMVEAFLPLMDASDTKRLCFVSSEAGSVERARRKAWFNYCMSKSALNMGVRILFNSLRHDGYTFRLYHPGGIRSYIGGSGVKGTRASMEPEEAAVPAVDYFEREMGVEEEERLVMRDWKGEEWPW